MGFGPGSRNFMSEEEKQNLPQVTPELLKRVFSYLAPYWKQLALTLLCIVFSSIMTLMPSILTGKIIDEGLIGRDFGKLIMYIVLSLAVTAGANLIGVAESYLNTWIAQHITFDMRNQMYSHLQNMSQRFFTSNNQGDIITRMTSDIDGVKTVISGTFTSILSNSITLIVALVAFLLISFLGTRLGLSIRATGDNIDMVRASSINPTFIITVGLCLANAMTALSGAMVGQYQKTVDINGGTGIVVIGLACLIIGETATGRRSVKKGAIAAIVGSIIYRIIYAVCLYTKVIPVEFLKLLTAAIVAVAIAFPALRKMAAFHKKKMEHTSGRAFAQKGGDGKDA